MGRLGPGPRLAAGVSGGAHSLALALLAQRWARERGGDLLALVVDHGLRAESAEEARQVAERLKGQGIRARILALGLAPGPGLQERARAARLAALAEAAARDGRPWLLLGHHRGDQAETLLFRALRGSGPDGLAAMAEARDAGAVMVLRPLLGTAPADLEAIVTAAGLAPVRDPSNRDRRFARIRLRDALDDPGGAGPGIAALAAAADAFAARRARTQAAMAERLAIAAEIRPEGFAWIDPAALGRDAAAAAALAWLAARIGGAAWRPAPARAAVLLAGGEGTLAGAWLRPAAGGRWLLARDPGAIGPPVEAVYGALWDRRFRLAGPGRAGFSLGALGADRVAGDASLPASVRRALPAIRDPNGALAAVPALFYPAPEACAPFATLFAPRLARGEFSGRPFKGGQPDLMCNREGRGEYPSGMETDTRT
jgi:tRNA(Ile)-lysidine synthase